jgi:RNA polymerase sigma-70 factor (ECF subfamily)
LNGEEELIQRAINLDPRAFGKLYDCYYPRIFGYVYRITGDYALACDVTSETFLKAWVKIGAFRWKGISISSWFFRIATNELNQYFRRKKYRPQLLSDHFPGGWTTAQEPSDPDQDQPMLRLERLEAYRKIHALLKTLPPVYQEVIALRYFEELSIPELSQILHKKQGTVKSLLSRGLQRLKKLMWDTATDGIA